MVEPCIQATNIARLNESISLTNKDISYMKEEISNTQKMVEKMDEKLDSLIEKLENKFASKRVERVVKGLVGLVLTSVFVALLAQVIQK